MKKVIYSLLVFVAIATLNSCTTYSYTSRSSAIKGATIDSRALGAEVTADFSRKVTATSDPQTTQSAAIQDAQFKCLQEANIDVIVDPIYKTEFNMFRKKGFIVTVIGYAGTLKQVPVGIDAVVDKKYSLDDIEKYKLLNDPNFYKYYYQKDNNTKGDVTNYYVGATPVVEKPAKQKIVLPVSSENQNSSNVRNKKDKHKNVEEQTGEFSSINSFKFGPTDRRAWSLDFGYRSLNRTDGTHEKQELSNGKKYIPGFRFGIGYNPTFKYGLGFKTGLNLDYAHCKSSSSSYYGYKKEENQDFVTIGLPLQVSYRYEVIRHLSLMLYTGPILNVDAYRGTDTPDGDNCFGMAWGIGAAVQWKRLRMNIGGDFGIYHQWNRDAESKKDKIFQNTPIYLTLGVML